MTSYKKDDLLVIEKAVAKSNNTYGLIKKCADLVELRGNEALKMGYLYDGDTFKLHDIPPLAIYTTNRYKKYKIPNVSTEQLNKMV